MSTDREPADASAPVRAFRLTLQLGADNRPELAWALHNMADQIEREELTVGVSGGPHSGALYELLHDPAQTHESYFRQLQEYLKDKKAAASPQPAAQPEQPEPGAFKPFGRCTCSGPDGPCETCESNREAYEEWLAERKVQPEPGGLTEAQALAIADKHGTRWAAADEEGISFEKSAFFDFLSEVLSTRKLLDQEPLNAAGETPTQHAHRWATELAISMARKLYPEVQHFEPLPDLLGVITQIDNMVTGLQRKRTAEQNARIMGLVGRLVSATVNAACLQEREPSVENQNKYWVARRALIAEVERLLGGEA